MNLGQVCKNSFFYSFGTLVYIILVATILSNGERIFGQVDNTFFGPVAFLLLFTLSAAVVGGLILGKPIMLYLDNKKKEAVWMFLSSAGWLLLYTIIAIIILALK